MSCIRSALDPSSVGMETGYEKSSLSSSPWWSGSPHPRILEGRLQQVFDTESLGPRLEVSDVQLVLDHKHGLDVPELSIQNLAAHLETLQFDQDDVFRRAKP